MVNIIFNDTNLWQLYDNATIKIQNCSKTVNDLNILNSQQQSQITLMWIIIIILILIFIFKTLYNIIRNIKAYRIGILYPTGFHWLWKWQLEETLKYDKQIYVPTKNSIYGNTILFPYKKPQPYTIFSDQIQTEDSDLSVLKRSTAIEKWVAANNFFQQLLIWTIIAAICAAIGLAIDYFIFNKPLICNLIINNTVAMQQVIK